MDLPNQRILITGAAGFLGRHVVERLWQIGCRRLTLPRRVEFDLTREADVVRLVATARPQLVIHLAARVGGIGANRRRPGTFAYENLIMGTRLIEECRAELTAEGVAHAPFALGIMVETPAAALLAEELAAEAAFSSIGTNDLTQYVLAADRLNPSVAHLNRPDHPAVLKAIEMVCRAAAKAGIWVGVCGEAAARPDLIATFAAMGVSELSLSAASILRAKKCVAEI